MTNEANEETRVLENGIVEHKHKDRDFWHPKSRIHSEDCDYDSQKRITQLIAQIKEGNKIIDDCTNKIFMYEFMVRNVKHLNKTMQIELDELRKQVNEVA